MNYCHKKSICHRDIKAENVIIAKDNTIKIIDFGLACKFKPEEGMNRCIGTMLYMAPEIARKKQYNEKSDMWAIGIVIFVMLTGRIPYREREPTKLNRLVKKGDYDQE